VLYLKLGLSKGRRLEGREGSLATWHAAESQRMVNSGKQALFSLSMVKAFRASYHDMVSLKQGIQSGGHKVMIRPLPYLSIVMMEKCLRFA
jgi:hypothetical protein